MKLRRSSIALVLVICGWGTMSVGEQMPAPRGELHVVDKSPFNWQYIVWNTFEHLVEVGKDGTLVPRLATGWRWLDDCTLEMMLRQGVTFHHGEVFDAEIVKFPLPVQSHSALRGEQKCGVCAVCDHAQSR